MDESYHWILFSSNWLKKIGCKKDLQCDNQPERDKLAELVDSIISCEIPEKDAEDDSPNPQSSELRVSVYMWGSGQ